MGLSSSNFENRPRAGETKTPGWGQQQPERLERSAKDRQQLPGRHEAAERKGTLSKHLILLCLQGLVDNGSNLQKKSSMSFEMISFPFHSIKRFP